MTPSIHLREQNALLSHYVDNRTLISLCGQSGLDWHLVLDNRRVPSCPVCRANYNLLNKIEGDNLDE